MLLFGKRNKEKKLAKQSSRSDSLDRGMSVVTKPVLGESLPSAVANSRCYDGIPLPVMVRQCIDYVEMHGLEMEGIYRVSAPISRLDMLEKQAQNGEPIEFVEAHDAAGLLKRFLRKLPEHVLAFAPFDPTAFEQVADSCKCKADHPCRCDAVVHLNEMLLKAPKENYYLIAYVFLHAAHVIENQQHNKMTLSALGVLLQAMLSVTKNVVRIFTLNASSTTAIANGTDEKPLFYLFADVSFKRYSKPLTSDEINASPPETITGLEEEINKQQNLLEEINDQVLEQRKQSCDTKQKEHEMWQVQQGITVLKRKLKNALRSLRSDGDEDASTSTASDNSCCEPGPLLEKQLVAIQNTLIEEIAEEQRQIAELATRLQDLQNDIESHSDRLSSASNSASRTPRPKKPPPPPPKVPILDPDILSTAIPTDGVLEELDPNCNECHRQEARKQVLVAQITEIRDNCAQLRAKLDDSRETMRVIDAADDIGTSSVLITKF